MNTLIQAAELWIPDLDAGLLEFGGGLYGEAVEFGISSRRMCFGRGEGLPGRVWESGRPILMKDLQVAHFRRAAAAREAGLVCAVAWPVVYAGVLRAVVVVFCGGASRQAGAVELWRNDPRVSTDLTLEDGYYGDLVEGFVADSRDTSLPRGAGLPGLAWQRQRSVWLDDIAASPKFVRAESAAAAGLATGLALPCVVDSREQYILSFLATTGTGLAPRLEIWRPLADGPGLERALGRCVGAGVLPAGPATRSDGTGDDLLATVQAAAMPQVQSPPPASLAGPGLRGVLAVPVIVDDEVVETIALSL